MNTRVEPFFRPSIRGSGSTWEGGSWLAAIAFALAAAIVAVIGLPRVLILPAVALALFAASVLPMIVTSGHPAAAREKARLLAGMLFFLGVVASVAADEAALATYFG